MLNGLQLYLLKRDIRIPFQINITSDDFLTGVGEILECTEVLHLSPQRKIVCRAIFQGQEVVARLYLHPDKAKNDQLQALSSDDRLIKIPVSTPKRLTYGTLNESGFYILYQYIPETTPLEKHILLKPNKKSLRCINDLMPVIAQMHHAGFQQLDLSLNHFVCNHNHSLMCMNSGHADGLHSLADERLAQIHKNLAKLLAQLPIIYDQSIKDFLISYQLGSVLCKKLSYSVICREIKQWRQLRIEKTLSEASGNGRKFVYDEKPQQTLIYSKAFSSPRWQIFFQQLDTLLKSSPCLKSGKDSTVILAECEGTKVAIKHYHNQGLLHRLGNLQQADPARQSWKMPIS